MLDSLAQFLARHEPRLTKIKQNPRQKCTQSEIPRFERETWGAGRVTAQEIGTRKAPFSKSARRGAPPICFSRRLRTKARYAFWVDVAQTADVGRPPRCPALEEPSLCTIISPITWDRTGWWKTRREAPANRMWTTIPTVGRKARTARPRLRKTTSSPARNETRRAGWTISGRDTTRRTWAAS